MPAPRKLEDLIVAVGDTITGNDKLYDQVRALVLEAHRSGQEAMAHPLVITFVNHDPDTEWVSILHDGQKTWEEQSFDSLFQYLRASCILGQPVVLEMSE